MGSGVVTISGASGLQGLARPEGVDPGRANREAMPDLTAKRTLVKSPPELWSELSEVERLARHLGAFGEIKITKLEPEHTVAWEGDGASGTVSIEPSGWGTKVTLTAQLEEAAVEEPVVAEPVAMDESPPLGTAAGEELKDEGGAESAQVAAPEAEELPADEPVMAAAEEEPAVDEAAAVEPPPVEPPAVEPPVVEPRVPEPSEPVEPVIAGPRRKRGFLAWLFRQRTSGQVTAPPVPAPSEPVAEAPAVEEPPVVVELPAVEEPLVAEEPAVAEEAVTEEPPVAEESPSAEESPGAEEPPVAEEPVVQEPLVAEPPVVHEPVGIEAPVPLDGSSTEDAAAHQDRLDRERAQAVLDGALDALGSAHHRPFSRG
jgi:hypothetical protein